MLNKEHLLDRFLNPKSLALFGSMQENSHFGPGVIIGDLLAWKYPGRIYPVHPTAKSVHGIKVYRDLRPGIRQFSRTRRNTFLSFE